MASAVQSFEIVVNGARLSVEEAGTGDPVVFLHGGLGDSRLWDAQFPWFARRFRTIRYDMRFFGRSDRPAAPYSLVDDLLALLDRLEISTAALIGLSLGGQVAIDATIVSPERVRALVPVCSALSGFTAADDADQQREFAAAIKAGGAVAAVEFALNVWAPLGATDLMRRLARENLRVHALPEGAVAAREPVDAIDRLGEIEAPTLVVTGDRDVPTIGEIADILHERIRGAERLRFDSDHYLPLREGIAFNEAVSGFLRRAI
jgi:3-oxoadipate enol-lactonase